MKAPRPTFGAFNQGDVPTIACFNKASVPLGRSVKFDRLKKVTKPFELLAGGYQIIFKNGKWTQILGSESKKKNFAMEDRRGHRSEQRKQRKLLRANPKAIARAERHG